MIAKFQTRMRVDTVGSRKLGFSFRLRGIKINIASYRQQINKDTSCNTLINLKHTDRWSSWRDIPQRAKPVLVFLLHSVMQIFTFFMVRKVSPFSATLELWRSRRCLPDYPGIDRLNKIKLTEGQDKFVHQFGGFIENSYVHILFLLLFGFCHTGR